MSRPNITAQLKKQQFLDWLFQKTTFLFAVFVFLSLIVLIVSLIIGSWSSLQTFGFGFLVTMEWNPVTERFGAWVPIAGTLITASIALAIGVPVSFGIAVFLTELVPVWLKRPLSTAIELLAGIPSIIYGMWGLFVFAPFFAASMQPWIQDTFGNIPAIGFLVEGPVMGIGMFTAGIILAIMIIPFIASVMRDVFDVVPSILKESAYALGATTWEVIWYVVLPYTKSGVVGAIMLGLGRALGETMAVTFVIGNAHQLHASLFMPGNSIASALANEFTEADSELYTSALIELGLILFLITFLVLACSKILLVQLKRREGAAT